MGVSEQFCSRSRAMFSFNDHSESQWELCSCVYFSTFVLV